jgi:large-conductance mechanosensitive channel
MATGNGGYWADFKKFINKGNVVDLRVIKIPLHILNIIFRDYA